MVYKHMTTTLLSDTDLAQEWLNQFETIQDRSSARILLNSLKYISNTDFESYIHSTLSNLQNSLNARLAVYPVIEPTPKAIIGQSLFNGNTINSEIVNSRLAGRRKKYGSEDRVGHILERISDAHRGNGTVSTIECIPTIKTIRRQGIKNIVFVDDICGSGQRFINFYQQEIPPYLKRLLSLKKVNFWFVCYAMTSSGMKLINRKIKYFKNNPDNILKNFDNLTFDKLLSQDVRDLCFKYNRKIYGNDSASLGYKNSIGGIVFEHGCPNNLPRILWDNNKRWNAIFKNRSIPTEIRPSFSEENLIDNSEVLWSVNQKNLAILILDSIENNQIEPRFNLIITLLGLLSRAGRSKESLASRAFLSISKIDEYVSQLIESDLIKEDMHNLKITPLGIAVLQRFKKNRLKKINFMEKIELEKENYYPSQCDGHLRFLADC